MEAMRSLQLQQYHNLFLSQNKRADGRGFEDFREIEVELNTIETADGSCAVRFGNTCVICGVSAMIVKPSPAEPDKGLIEIVCKLPPNALHDFKWSRDAFADQEVILSSKLKEIVSSSNSLDLKQLNIEEGNHVWSLSLEIIVLDYDGNILDTCLTAVLGCLACTSLPVVEVGEETDNPLTQFVFKKERIPLVLKSFPFSTTFAVFGEDVVVSDPTAEEESLSGSSVSLVISYPDQLIVSIIKDGGNVIGDDMLLSKVVFAQNRTRILQEKMTK